VVQVARAASAFLSWMRFVDYGRDKRILRTVQSELKHGRADLEENVRYAETVRSVDWMMTRNSSTTSPCPISLR